MMFILTSREIDSNIHLTLNIHLKNLHSGDRFQKAAVTAWTEDVSGEKSSVFKNIRIRVDGASRKN